MILFQNKVFMRTLSLVLVCLMFFACFAMPQADAIAIADDAVLLCGAAVAVMVAAGVYFTSTNTSSDDFGSWLSGKIDTFISSEGSGSVADYASGISLNPSGTGLNVSNPVMSFLNRFCDWFKNDEDLTADSKSVYPSSSSGIVSFSFPSYFIYDSRAIKVDLESTGIYAYWSVPNSTTISMYSRLYYTSNSSSYPSFLRFNFSDGTYALGSSSSFSSLISSNPSYLRDYSFEIPSISASYTANSAYTYDSTANPSAGYNIGVRTSGSGSGGDGNDDTYDTAASLATSALALALAGTLASDVAEEVTEEDSTFDNVLDGLRSVVGHITALKSSLADGFTSVLDGVKESLLNTFTGVIEFCTTFWDTFPAKCKEVFGDIGEGIKEAVNTGTKAIEAAKTAVVEAVQEMVDTFSNKFDDFKEKWENRSNTPGTFVFAAWDSIWHYVVDWINYISSFISVILTVWTALPSAIVMPVYASVVLVLYFGIYRKFIR